MSDTKISKIIYQTWETKDLDPNMRAAMQTWIDMNPEYEHRLCDAKDRRDFVAEHFSERILKAYDKLRPGTYQADFWRYCVLYMTGGICVDIDVQCKLPMSTVISDSDEFVSGKAPSYEFAIWVGFVAARKGHPFLKLALDKVVHNIETDYYGEGGVWPTGPVATGIAVNRYAGLPDRHPYKLGINTRGDYKFKLLPFDSKTKEVLNDAGEVVMMINYDGYITYRNKTVIAYPIAWREGKIYHYDKPSKIRAMKQAWRMVTTRQGRRYSKSLIGQKAEALRPIKLKCDELSAKLKKRSKTYAKAIEFIKSR